jgi:hypothetical protein
MFAIQPGLDTTEPLYDRNVTITIPAGGIVEVNGVLFKVTNTVTLTRQDALYFYWVAVKDNGDGTASFFLVRNPGAWYPDKKGCYLPPGTTDGNGNDLSGARTLNWVTDNSYNNLSISNRVYTRTTKGKDIILLNYGIKGWYLAELRSGSDGSLGGGQDGTNATSSSAGTGGAGDTADIAGESKIIMFFYDGKSLTIRVGGSGGPGGKGGDGVRVSGSGAQVAGGGGGGGGCGSGEATEIAGIAKTKGGKAGRGGNGGTGSTGGGMGGGGGGTPGGTGYDGGGLKGGVGGGVPQLTSTAGGGGNYGGGDGSAGTAGTGGGGGGQGLNGEDQPDGAPGGYCNIFKAWS